jgi:hypothetical protein
VERHVRDVLLPGSFHDALSAVHFPQDADFLLRAITFPFHDLGPFCWAQTNSSSGSKNRDHVSDLLRIDASHNLSEDGGAGVHAPSANTAEVFVEIESRAS